MAAEPAAAAPATSVPALYVGDLDAKIADRDLYDLFFTVGVVASVRVCKDTTTGGSLGYGYVNYIALQDGMLYCKKKKKKGKKNSDSSLRI